MQDYGFTETEASGPLITSIDPPPTFLSYESSGLTEDDYSAIYERIESVCSSGQTEKIAYGANWSISKEDQISVSIRLSRTSIWETVSLDTVVFRTNKPSLWQRIRGLWSQ